MRPQAGIRTLRRIMRERQVPPHLRHHLSWLLRKPVRRDAGGDEAPQPVMPAVAAAAAELLVTLQAQGFVAFLIDDRGHEICLGLGDEDRSKAIEVVRTTMPDWTVRRRIDQLILAPTWLGSGGARIRVSLWQKNNLGEREQVGVRGLNRLFADDVLGRSELAGRSVPTAPTFVPERLRHRPRFAIDAVISWVDDSDVQWLARKNAALQSARPDFDGTTAARFRSRDELRYLLRSLHSFAPFFRHVFIVTDCRPPAWLRLDHPGLTVIEQTPLLGGEPVFNSLAVETALHRIPALSEHYVYFNDDMFIARPIEPELFFAPTGLMRLTQGPLIRAGVPVAHCGAFETAAQQARDLVQQEFGWTPRFSVNHVPLPQRISIALAMEERFRTAITATRTSTFRDIANTTSATGLIHYVAEQIEGVCASELAWRYIDTASRFAPSQYDELLHRPTVDTFCCNDEGQPASGSPAESERALSAFLRAYFPTPSPFEVTPSATSGSSVASRTRR